MRKLKLSRALYVCCNICLILISIAVIIYSTASLYLSHKEGKYIFNAVNKDYETCFGQKYMHKSSYFTDIACMKMEISSGSITKSADFKKQYLDFSNKSKNTNKTEPAGNTNYNKLKDSLNDIRNYNKEISYRESLLPLLKNCSSLYSALNYMTYGNNALLEDILNFSSDQEALSLAADKDIQEIHVMANISSNVVQNLNRQIYFYRYAALFCLFVLLVTSVNIYRIRARKHKYKRKLVQKK